MRHADTVAGGGTGARNFPNANRIDLTGTGPQITGNRITVSCWFSQDVGGGATEGLVGRWNGGASTSSWVMQIGGSQLQALIHDGAGSDSLTVPTAPIQGQPLKHACFTKDGSELRFYVNGKLETHGASTRSMNNVGSPCLGDTALALPYDGVLKHAAVWDETLTSWEVMQLAQGVAPWDVRGAKLRLWIPLNDWAGGTGTARDLSTRNSAATPAGGTTYTLREGAPTPMPVNPLRFLQQELPQLLLGGFFFQVPVASN